MEDPTSGNRPRRSRRLKQVSVSQSPVASAVVSPDSTPPHTAAAPRRSRRLRQSLEEDRCHVVQEEEDDDRKPAAVDLKKSVGDGGGDNVNSEAFCKKKVVEGVDDVSKKISVRRDRKKSVISKSKTKSKGLSDVKKIKKATSSYKKVEFNEEDVNTICYPVPDNEEEVRVPAAGEPDGKGGLYNPFYRVEYSKTGRATCRRCDMRIEKGAVRVGHRPLFRGKPGFEIYRHLACAVFDANVASVEDIDGISDLEEEDKENVALRIEESKIELCDEQKSISPDELVAKSFEGEIRSPPPGLDAELLPFQVEGVSWMYAQETKEDVKGGILADEMGMGKTIQTITVMLDNRPKLQHYNINGKRSPDFQREEKLWSEANEQWKTEMVKSNVPKKLQPKDGPLSAGTLVVCPVVALDQWKSEIEKFTHDSSLTVGIYHGQQRASSLPRELLCKYDVVLTTYQVIEADFRKMASPNKVKCPNCGKKFKIDRLKLHLKYYCGEFAERTEAQARQIRASERGNHHRGQRRQEGKEVHLSKKSMQKNFSEKGKRIKKKVIHIKSAEGMESESDLSVDFLEKRASFKVKTPRKAASKAIDKLSASKQSLYAKYNDVDDEGSYKETSSDSEDESLSEEEISIVRLKKKSVYHKKQNPLRTSKVALSENTSDSSDEELNNAAVERQRKALETARFGSKRKGKKSFPAKKEMKKLSKFESDEDADDIDMDKLIREAQANSCMSVLHR